MAEAGNRGRVPAAHPSVLLKGDRYVLSRRSCLILKLHIPSGWLQKAFFLRFSLLKRYAYIYHLMSRPQFLKHKSTIDYHSQAFKIYQHNPFSWQRPGVFKIQADPKGIAGSVTGHHNKENITKKGVTQFFWFPMHIKVAYTILQSIKGATALCLQKSTYLLI